MSSFEKKSYYSTSIATIVSAIALFFSIYSFKKSLDKTEESLFLSREQFTYSQKKDSIENYENNLSDLEQKQRFLEEIRVQREIANKNIEVLNKENRFLAIQLDLQKQEDLAKLNESIIKLKRIINKIREINYISFSSTDSLKFRKEMEDSIVRMQILKGISFLIENEQNNKIIFQNDTILYFWQKIHESTESEIRFNRNTRKNHAFIDNNGIQNPTNDIYLLTFWYYCKDINFKLNIISLLIHQKYPNIRLNQYDGINVRSLLDEKYIYDEMIYGKKRKNN